MLVVFIPSRIFKRNDARFDPFLIPSPYSFLIEINEEFNIKCVVQRERVRETKSTVLTILVYYS